MQWLGWGEIPGEVGIIVKYNAPYFPRASRNVWNRKTQVRGIFGIFSKYFIFYASYSHKGKAIRFTNLVSKYQSSFKIPLLKRHKIPFFSGSAFKECFSKHFSGTCPNSKQSFYVSQLFSICHYYMLINHSESIYESNSTH